MAFVSAKAPPDYFAHLEDVADALFASTKKILPHLARLCLLGTFLQDGIEMALTFSLHVDHLHLMWGGPRLLLLSATLINIVSLIAPSLMVLVRFRIGCAVLVLVCNIFYQLILYWSMYDGLVGRAISLVGALCMLAAESHRDAKSLFAGVPMADDSNRSLSWLKFTGRFLLLVEFVNELFFEIGNYSYFISGGVCVLMILVLIGWKTRLTTLFLVAVLIFNNFHYNSFWLSEGNYQRFEFFRVVSIIGGLLLLVSLGPGPVSLDEKSRSY